MHASNTLNTRVSRQTDPRLPGSIAGTFLPLYNNSPVRYVTTTVISVITAQLRAALRTRT